MTSTGVARRQRSAWADKQAAKQKRQRTIAIVGFAILILIGIYEVPHTIKLLTKSSTTTVSTPPPVSAPKPAPPKNLFSGHAADPFAVRTFSAHDPVVGAPLPGRDPFASPPSSAPSNPAPSAPISASTPIPQTLVIGTPSAGKKAQSGWIVILASIPTGEGRTAAEAFQRRASRDGVGQLGILNSSNRRPLRGGYWVVYTGPYSTLNEVTNRANDVHAAGYSTAYIRGLLVYR